MVKENKNYLPALRFEFLTRFYDPLVRFTTRESTFKRSLISQADLQNGQVLLDLACGTGTLAVALKKNVPAAQVYGFDADEKILQLAKKKAAKANVEVHFEQGFSFDLPFADGTFDRVFSTLAFHHLSHAGKVTTINEIRRVLKNDGEFHLADYGLPRNKRQFVLSKIVRMIDGSETTEDNLRGRLGVLLEQNGFGQVKRTGYVKTIIGTIRLFKAVK